MISSTELNSYNICSSLITTTGNSEISNLLIKEFKDIKSLSTDIGIKIILFPSSCFETSSILNFSFDKSRKHNLGKYCLKCRKLQYLIKKQKEIK